MGRLWQVIAAFVPLLLTPLLVYALAEGLLNFGGGEKDILLALPWLIWSVAFAFCACVLIFRRRPVGIWVLRSALVATVLLVVLGVVAYVSSILGIA